MIKYPTEVKETSPAVDTGRILFIKNMTEFTPRKLYTYIDEGFLPVVLDSANGYVTPALLTYPVSLADWTEGSYVSYVDAGSEPQEFTAADIDTNFALISSSVEGD